MSKEMQFEIKSTTRAHTPEGGMLIILEVYLPETGEIVWCSGDDQGCAVTRKDFIQNRQVDYDKVLIYENVYQTATPESAGKWYPVIKEMIGRMVAEYLEKYHVAHLFPQWMPEEAHSLSKELFTEMTKDCDYITLYPGGIMDFVPKSTTTPVQNKNKKDKGDH